MYLDLRDWKSSSSSGLSGFTNETDEIDRIQLLEQIASFLTGRHPNRMGTFSPGWSFRPEEITIADVMSDAG